MKKILPKNPKKYTRNRKVSHTIEAEKDKAAYVILEAQSKDVAHAIAYSNGDPDKVFYFLIRFLVRRDGRHMRYASIPKLEADIYITLTNVLNEMVEPLFIEHQSEIKF
jgi:hypothetical protein